MMASEKIDRVALRPDPAQWGEDEIMSLDEAARLHWPSGWPVTSRSLRREARPGGRLAISRLGKRIFVTRRALASLSECKLVNARVIAGDAEGASRDGAHLADLAAIKRLRR
jgi:hypothetical protein